MKRYFLLLLAAILLLSGCSSTVEPPVVIPENNVEEEKPRVFTNGEWDLVENLYKENNFEEVLEFCKEKGFSLYDYVKYYEPDIDSYLDIVYDTMEKSIKDGLEAKAVLPGRLKLERKANEFYQKYLKNNHLKSLIFNFITISPVL